MSSTLQVALFIACVVVVLSLSLLVPLSILLYRSARNLVRQIEELQTDLKELVQDSRTTVQSMRRLSVHANNQLDELDKIASIARGWVERVDRVVDGLGSVVESPLTGVARNVKLLRHALRIVSGLFANDSMRSKSKDAESNGLKK